MAKYDVYVEYVATKWLGKVEANSKEEAIEKLRDEADCSASLCWECSQEFLDAPMIDEDSFSAEETND